MTIPPPSRHPAASPTSGPPATRDLRYAQTQLIGPRANVGGSQLSGGNVTRVISQSTSKLDDAASLADLGRIARSFAANSGFEHFLYAVRLPRPPGPAIHFVVNGYPAEWRRRYDEREYLRIDPIVQHAFGSAMPAVWDEIPVVTEQVRAFFAEATSYGLAHGISAPILGRRGELGLFSLSRLAEIDAAEDERLALKQELHWFSTAFHEAAMRLFEPQAQKGRQPLTSRERECLLWAYEGKKSTEIALLMGITERTVHHHLEQAGQKLGTTGRKKIIDAAISRGELEPIRQALRGTHPLPETRELAS